VDLPGEPRLRWILRATARLLEGGTEPVSGLILPTSEHFPDRFDASPAAVERLLGRVRAHAGLIEVPIRVEVAGAGGHGSSCASGSCCSTGAPSAPLQRVRRLGERDGYLVSVAAAEVGNPAVLTTALVRAVSHVFLTEAQLYREFQRAEAEGVVDLCGCLLGFGVLLGNGSYIYSKGCGGPRVSSATKLPVEEICLALGLFCRLHQLPPRSAAVHLDPTPRAHFDAAEQWVRSNAGVVSLLRTDRAAIEAETYSLSEARSWLSRLFGLGRARGPSVPTDEELERVAKSLEAKRAGKSVDPARAQRLQELRALVDDALER
jgi:hypothetical protein